jgi:hypothetical protein
MVYATLASTSTLRILEGMALGNFESHMTHMAAAFSPRFIRTQGKGCQAERPRIRRIIYKTKLKELCNMPSCTHVDTENPEKGLYYTLLL